MNQTNHHALIGLWKLKQYVVEVQETGEKLFTLGEHPNGYATFTQDGHVMVTLAAQDRAPAVTDADSTELLKTLVAYAGTYRLEGDEWITHVEVAWNPSWVGTEQRRFFTMTGNSMEVKTTWRVMPNWQSIGMQRSILTFVKM